MITAGAGRKGTAGIVTNGTTFFTLDRSALNAAISSLTLYRGISMNLDALPGSTATIMQFSEADNTAQVCIGLLTDGTVRAFRGNTAGTTLASSASPVTTGFEYYLEVFVFIDNATGRVQVKLWTGPSTSTTIIDFTGDTQNAGTGLIAKIIGGLGLAASWDDGYLADDAFRGNKHYQATFPDAAGHYTQWQPFPSTPNYANEYENPPNADTNYNYAPSTDGDTDTYITGSVTDTGATLVNVKLCTEGTSSNADAVAAVVRLASTDDVSAEVIPDELSYSIIQYPFETAPDGSAWTTALVNSAEKGQSVAAGITYWLLPYLSVYGEGTAISITPANRVQVLRVFVPYSILVSRLTIKIGVTDAGNFWGTGLYSEDGNTLILDSGPITTAVSGNIANTITPVLVEAGMYWYAWTSDSTTVTVGTAVIDIQAATIREDGTSQIGFVANASVAGQLPATMGAFTPEAAAADSVPLTALH